MMIDHYMTLYDPKGNIPIFKIYSHIQCFIILQTLVLDGFGLLLYTVMVSNDD